MNGKLLAFYYVWKQGKNMKNGFLDLLAMNDNDLNM